MADIPTYPALKKPEDDTVARSIANPNAFAKPATMAKPGTRSVRVRTMVAKTPRRGRRRKADLRQVKFY